MGKAQGVRICHIDMLQLSTFLLHGDLKTRKYSRHKNKIFTCPFLIGDCLLAQPVVRLFYLLQFTLLLTVTYLGFMIQVKSLIAFILLVTESIHSG